MAMSGPVQRKTRTSTPTIINTWLGVPLTARRFARTNQQFAKLPDMLNNEPAVSFLARYWQKSPAFLPSAVTDSLPSLDADELAWLATLPDVESRLVLSVRDGNAMRYSLENGPFDEARLSNLPGQDWTLLVNDVDKHLPDFRSYLDMIDFVPDWRIDDLMVSCAAPGGSVGPHEDNYDVFLVQGTGTRDWRFGSRLGTEPDESSEALSLVKPFAALERVSCRDGDILYLPPHTPHWGIAAELCMTYSIGMRAPTSDELQLAAERCLRRDAPQRRSGDHLFYADPDLGAGEADPGQISEQVIARLKAQSLVDDSLTDTEIATILGCTVTDPKAWLAPEAVTGPDASARIADSRALPVHGMARIAWYRQADRGVVFVNGVARTLDADQLDVVLQLCRDRRLGAGNKRELANSPAGRELLVWLLAEGLFDVADAGE
jgi:50S ribosomal protein L16 3-hydroxylase